jgi:hypothetical protein
MKKLLTIIGLCLMMNASYAVGDLSLDDEGTTRLGPQEHVDCDRTDMGAVRGQEELELGDDEGGTPGSITT